MAVIQSGNIPLQPSGSTPKGGPAGGPSAKGARSTANEGTVTLKDPGPRPTAAEVNKWYSEQINYENLASNTSIAERAKFFVQEHRVLSEQHNYQIREKWRTMLEVLHSEIDLDIKQVDYQNVPALWEKLEALVPRLVEAVLSYDPWFAVVGRTADDRKKSERIRDYLSFQLDKDHFDEKVEEVLRTGLMYQSAVVKVVYSVEQSPHVHRQVTNNRDGTYTIKRKEENRVTHEGPRLKLVDPLNWIIDPKATSVRDSLYCGDTCLMTYDQIKALGQQGVYINYEAIRGTEPITHAGDQTQWDKLERDIDDSQDDSYTNRWPDGTPKEYEVTEMWCLFDIWGTGESRECVITIANGQHVLRVQENPYDSKFRPYAAWRCAKEPFQWNNIGPLDHAIRLNLELNDIRTLGHQGAKNTINPFVRVDPGEEIPDSIFDLEQGAIIRATGWDWQKAPSNLVDWIQFEAKYEKNIDGATGVPKVYEGAGNNDTATETERNFKEANRRTRGLVVGISHFLEDLLTIMHELNGQYVTRKQTFRVLASGGKKTTAYSEVGPEDFSTPVDFTFKAVHGLNNLGLRSTQLMQFLNTVYPLLPLLEQQGVKVDVGALVMDLYREQIGSRPEEDIISRTPDFDELMSPEDENIMMEQGQEVDVHEYDDDEAHIMSHAQQVDDPTFDDWDPQNQALMAVHIQEHIQAGEQKTLRRAAAMQDNPTGPRRPPEDPEGQQAPYDPNRGDDGQPGVHRALHDGDQRSSVSVLDSGA